MAKTLDQLPAGAYPSPSDIFLTQQGGLDKQLAYSVVERAVLDKLPVEVPPIKVNEAGLADWATKVEWTGVQNPPTTWLWERVINRPTTIVGYNITDALRNNVDNTLNGSLNMTGNLTVTGNVTISGTTTQVNTTQVNIADNVIVINSNLTGAPPSNLQGGIQVNRGTSLAYQFLWDEQSQAFRIGQVGNLQAVATRSDSASMISGGLAFWNTALNNLNTASSLTWDGANLRATNTIVSGTVTAATVAATSTITSPSVTTTGNITSGGRFLAKRSTTGGYSFTGEVNSDTGVFSSGEGILELYSNGVNALNVTAGGTQWNMSGNLSLAGNLSPEGNLIGQSDKTVSGFGKVYNAVWNDIADFVDIGDDVDVIFGRAYSRLGSGDIVKAQGYMQKGVLGIASDTYGFGVGQKQYKRQLPIAIGGFVLACVDKVYEPGTPLTCTEGGYLTEFDMENKMRYPERLLAIFDRVEKQPTWNGLAVKGRHWVKIF